MQRKYSRTHYKLIPSYIHNSQYQLFRSSTLLYKKMRFPSVIIIFLAVAGFILSCRLAQVFLEVWIDKRRRKSAEATRARTAATVVPLREVVSSEGYDGRANLVEENLRSVEVRERGEGVNAGWGDVEMHRVEEVESISPPPYEPPPSYRSNGRFKI